MSHESERVWDLFVITVGIFFLLLLAWTPLVLSFTFPKLKLAPGSQAGPVFMSLRLGQYFSVEPDRRDPLYKTLTKNRQPPCPQARGPPAPCVERSPPGRPAGPTAPRAPQPPGLRQAPGPHKPPGPYQSLRPCQPHGPYPPPGLRQPHPILRSPRPDGSSPPSRLPGPAMSPAGGEPPGPRSAAVAVRRCSGAHPAEGSQTPTPNLHWLAGYRGCDWGNKRYLRSGWDSAFASAACKDV